MSQNPRLHFFKFAAPGLKRTIVVAHAPYSHASDLERNMYWGNITAETEKYNGDIILIDTGGTT
eukprot:2415145-Pyramimonas_sp.AAC.1